MLFKFCADFEWVNATLKEWEEIYYYCDSIEERRIAPKRLISLQLRILRFFDALTMPIFNCVPSFFFACAVDENLLHKAFDKKKFPYWIFKLTKVNLWTAKKEKIINLFHFLCSLHNTTHQIIGSRKETIECCDVRLIPLSYNTNSPLTSINFHQIHRFK